MNIKKNITIIKKPKKKKLISEYKPESNPNFTQREQELKILQCSLEQNNKLLIYGIGGIGKTTIAKELVKNQSNVYFFDIEVGLKTALTPHLLEELKEEEILNKVGEYLNEESNYIILDNALTTDGKDIKSFISKLPNAKVIITSRDKNFNVNLNSEPIDRLSDDETYQMFIKYLEKNYSKEQLEPLLRFTANTPLVIEVLAKQSKKMLKRRELNEVIEYFKDSNLNLKSKIPLSRDDVNSKDITEIINTIFKSNQIERQEQKELLTALANLSPEGVSLDNLIKWLNIEDEDELIETLEELESLGWLSEREEENRAIYQIHRIIKEVIDKNIKQPKTIDLLINSLAKQLKLKNLNNNDLNGKKYLLDVKELIKNDLETEEFTILLNNLSLILKALGDLNEAKKHQLKATEIFEKVLEPSHPSLAILYNNMATLYYYMEDYREAKVWIDKAWNIIKEVFEKSHPYYQGTLETKQVIESKL